jgi:hypothetical protein
VNFEACQTDGTSRLGSGSMKVYPSPPPRRHGPVRRLRDLGGQTLGGCPDAGTAAVTSVNVVTGLVSAKDATPVKLLPVSTNRAIG